MAVLSHNQIGHDQRGVTAFHICCAPAIGHESFGIVLLEAMALGKPVVASDIPGYAGVLTNAQEGLLVKPRSAHDLAKAISRLVEDKLLRDRLGRQGLATVQNYSWEKVALRVEAYYRQVLEKCGKAPPAGVADAKTPESLPV